MSATEGKLPPVLKPSRQHQQRTDSRVKVASSEEERDTAQVGDISRVGRVFTKSIVGDLFGSHRTATTSFVNSLTYRTRIMAKSDMTVQVSPNMIGSDKIIYDWIRHPSAFLILLRATS